MTRGNTSRAILLGLLSAVFFSVTLILNRKMGLEGGYWGWMASLRFFIMLPLLALPVTLRGEWRVLLGELRAHGRYWLLWSTVGFGLFYAPFTYANSMTPAWLMGGTWQLTILMGLLLSPSLYRDERRRIPLPALLTTGLILVGVGMMQLEYAQSLPGVGALLPGILMTLVAATCYPLGNRKMMLHLEQTGTPLSVYGRVMGMTLCSLPFWFLISGVSYAQVGLPSMSEVVQAGLIALSSGVIATLLFFRATELVREHATGLAAVEATQAAEVVFALVGEVWLLGVLWPSAWANGGLLLILLGMVMYSSITRPEVTGERGLEA